MNPDDSLVPLDRRVGLSAYPPDAGDADADEDAAQELAAAQMEHLRRSQHSFHTRPAALPTSYPPLDDELRARLEQARQARQQEH